MINRALGMKHRETTGNNGSVHEIVHEMRRSRGNTHDLHRAAHQATSPPSRQAAISSAHDHQAAPVALFAAACRCAALTYRYDTPIGGGIISVGVNRINHRLGRRHHPHRPPAHLLLFVVGIVVPLCPPQAGGSVVLPGAEPVQVSLGIRHVLPLLRRGR